MQPARNEEGSLSSRRIANACGTWSILPGDDWPTEITILPMTRRLLEPLSSIALSASLVSFTLASMTAESRRPCPIPNEPLRLPYHISFGPIVRFAPYCRMGS
jgi:hypothetical protein